MAAEEDAREKAKEASKMAETLRQIDAEENKLKEEAERQRVMDAAAKTLEKQSKIKDAIRKAHASDDEIHHQLNVQQQRDIDEQDYYAKRANIERLEVEFEARDQQNKEHFIKHTMPDLMAKTQQRLKEKQEKEEQERKEQEERKKLEAKAREQEAYAALEAVRNEMEVVEQKRQKVEKDVRISSRPRDEKKKLLDFAAKEVTDKVKEYNQRLSEYQKAHAEVHGTKVYTRNKDHLRPSSVQRRDSPSSSASTKSHSRTSSVSSKKKPSTSDSSSQKKAQPDPGVLIISESKRDKFAKPDYRDDRGNYRIKIPYMEFRYKALNFDDVSVQLPISGQLIPHTLMNWGSGSRWPRS